MVKVPKHIEKAIRDSGKYHQKAAAADKALREWLDEIGQGENDTIIDQIVDCLEMGFNDPERVIRIIEQET